MRVAVVVMSLVLSRELTAGAEPTPAASSAPAPSSGSLAVVALPGAADAAWPLAQSIYADPALRPGSVDETHARVLCGETPANASPELRDLGDTVAALRGDDAPSRTLLEGIARRFALRALMVVRADDGHPTARLFLAESGAFDAASYAPDDPPTVPGPSWSATVRSLDRLYGAPPPAQASIRAPILATREAPRSETSGPRPFYQSGWFWGALGAAALLGGAAYMATRDSSPPAIHLEVQVPH
jgi:hypothetical protein